MFDSLAIDLTNHLHDYETRIITQARSEIDWLSNEGLLTTLSGILASEDPGILKDDVEIDGLFLLPEEIAKPMLRLSATTFKAYNGLQDLRKIASKLRSLKRVDAVAVGTSETPIELDQPADRDTVIKITLGEFPTPSDSTSWESILDFKKEANTLEQFQRLKSWMNKTGREGLKSYEVTDELRGLILGYEQHMELCNMKLQHSMVEIIVTTTAEIAESIIRLKFSDIAKQFFKAEAQRIKLLEEERKADGKEIAYIVNAKKAFSK
jgi:hypothetical protein